MQSVCNALLAVVRITQIAPRLVRAAAFFHVLRQFVVQQQLPLATQTHQFRGNPKSGGVAFNFFFRFQDTLVTTTALHSNKPQA